MTHWAAKYIGIPYARGARGPYQYDCWGIIQLIYSNEKGISLPEMPGISAEDLRAIHNCILEESKHDWQETAIPKEGCVVVMGSQVVMHHVGIWIDCDGGKVLHNRAGQNTIAESIRRIRLKGMKRIKFYQHSKWLG